MSDPPLRPRKQRAIRTCQRCREHKLKCDRQQPCTGCVESNQAERCIYRGDAIRRGGDTSRQSSVGRDTARTNGTQGNQNQPRAVIACLRCRRLKQRCDQGRPCAGCVRGGVEDRCEYDQWAYESSGSAREEHGGDRAVTLSGAGVTGDTGTKARYHVAEGLTSALPPVRAYVPAFPSDLGTLMGLFPSRAECRRLLADFMNFDIMFRLTHAPSFMRRAEAAIDRLPHAELSDAPFLALLSECLCTAITLSTSPDRIDAERHIIALSTSLISLCDAQSAYNLDYVHALLVGACARLGGGTASPACLFLELGRAYHAALLIGLHRDQPGETPFEREQRRRVWYHILIQRYLMADRLYIHSELEIHVVPRPLIISDAQLDVIDTVPPSVNRDALTEWGYIDSKADMVNLLMQRKRIMSDESVPLPERWEQAEALIAGYLTNLPAHLTMGGSRQPGMPHWVYMQACAIEVSAHDLRVQLYHQYFSSPDPTIVSLALVKAIEAGHRLADCTRALMTFVIFDYVDAPSSGLWTYTMKVFTAGLLMGYYLLAVPTCPETPRHLAALDAMVGVLRSTALMGGSTTSNYEALKTLETLRARVRGTPLPGDNDMVDVSDPYTGQALPLPFTLAIQNVLPGDWLEWETLFRDFFETEQ